VAKVPFRLKFLIRSKRIKRWLSIVWRVDKFLGCGVFGLENVGLVEGVLCFMAIRWIKCSCLVEWFGSGLEVGIKKYMFVVFC